jgi:hypothetical protein
MYFRNLIWFIFLHACNFDLLVSFPDVSTLAHFITVFFCIPLKRQTHILSFLCIYLRNNLSSCVQLNTCFFPFYSVLSC